MSGKRKDTSRMGAPKKEPELRKSHQIAVRIEPALFQRLEEISKREGRSLSDVGRDLIKNSLEF